jgi:hypothetical protein
MRAGTRPMTAWVMLKKHHMGWKRPEVVGGL